MRLQQHINEENNLEEILFTLALIEECHNANDINEGLVTDSINSIIKSVKSMVKKKKPNVSKYVENEKGLMNYFKDFSIGGAQMMYHAFNAYYNNDQKSRERVKELAKSVKKEHILDVLLKLDTLSLHMVTGPLHIIEAVTGWDFVSQIKSKIEPVEKRVKHALHSLEALKNDLSGDMKVQLVRYTNGLRRVFDLGDFSRIKEETVGGDIANTDTLIGDFARRNPPKKKKKK